MRPVQHAGERCEDRLLETRDEETPMTEQRMTKWSVTDADKVYQQYLQQPATPQDSSYLDTHFKSGLAGLREPLRSQVLAHAAWRAGREYARRIAEGAAPRP